MVFVSFQRSFHVEYIFICCSAVHLQFIFCCVPGGLKVETFYTNNLHLSNFYKGVGIAQVGMATGWTARVRFPAWQDFYLLHSAQTDSGAHPASYSVGAGGGIYPVIKRPGRGAHLRLMLRSRLMELYLCFRMPSWRSA
jgi:hypothetical protein